MPADENHRRAATLNRAGFPDNGADVWLPL